MTGTFPNATLTIDTLSDDRSWERAIARGCLNGADRSPVTDPNASSRSRHVERSKVITRSIGELLDEMVQHRAKLLGVEPIEFIGDHHPHRHYD